MTCSQCGGDVVRLFVGTVEKYVHAVKGIDHGPLPTLASIQKQDEAAAPKPTSPAIPVAGPRPASRSMSARRTAV